MAEAVRVDLEELGCDVSWDVIGNNDPSVSRESMDSSCMPRACPQAIGSGSERSGFSIESVEEDVPQGAVVMHQSSDGHDATGSVTELVRDSEEDRVEKLFPNSFKVSGIKHVCDNALSSLLQTMPKCTIIGFSSGIFGFVFLNKYNTKYSPIL